MKTLTLKKPIKLSDNKEVTELKFREYATAEDLLAFDEIGPNKQAISLIASLTGTDEALIKKLRVTDFRAADAIASQLLEDQSDEKNG